MPVELTLAEGGIPAAPLLGERGRAMAFQQPGEFRIRSPLVVGPDRQPPTLARRKTIFKTIGYMCALVGA